MLTMGEITVQNECRLKASEMGSTLWRNNVGGFRNDQGRWINFGLCVGSSDLIGFTPVTITEDMVGKVLAVFTAMEVKTETGTLRKEQKKYISFVQKHGGIAGVVKSKKDVENLLDLCDK